MAIEMKYIAGIRRNLNEFGYPVDYKTVEEAVRRIEAGEDISGDIIAMFARDMLEEAGLIPARDAGLEAR